MKCEYCQRPNQSGDFCLHCGAKLPQSKQEEWESEPFFYNGYICYFFRHPEEDSYEVQFWLGRELIERIEVTRELVREHVPEYCDSMPFFWDLFLVAHGEQEVLEWQEKNKKYPATFLVTRIEHPEKERIRALSMYDIAQESKL